MKKKTIIIVFALSLLISVISVTYAYFALNQNTNSSNVTIVTGNTTLVLEDVDPITQTDNISANNTTIVRYLTIRNDGSIDGYAKLLFKDLYNDFVTEDLVYSLEEVKSDNSSLTSPNVIVDREVIPKRSTAVNTELANGLLIPASTSKYYKLTVHYNYSTTENQDADLNKVLTSGFIIEEGSNQNTVFLKGAKSITQSENTGLDNLNVTRYLTVSNNSTSNIKSNLLFTNIVNTFETDNLVYSLEEVKSDNSSYDPAKMIVTEEVVPKSSVSSEQILVSDIKVPAESNKYYKLTLNYDETKGGNKNNDTGKVIVSDFEARSIEVIPGKKIYCVDDNGEEITCPSSWNKGDRIAIGSGSKTQYFRFLRSTYPYTYYSLYFSECGTTSSSRCPDKTTGDLRFLAEHNLKRTDSNTGSGGAIAPDALQDPNDSGEINGVQYGPNNSDYNQSYVKTYMTNYQNVINTMIGETNIFSVNLLSYREAEYYFSCAESGYPRCTNVPSWASNSKYWLGSAYNETEVWLFNNNTDALGHNPCNYAFEGARPVITISRDNLKNLLEKN